MSGLLIGPEFLARHGERLSAVEAEAGLDLERIVLPDDPDGRVDRDLCQRIELAFFSGDIFPNRSRSFFAAAYGAPNLRWLQVFNAGVDHPVFTSFIERGVTLTTAAGAGAVPIAQSAITGLLMLARGFPDWLDAQRRRAWEPRTDPPEGSELSEQTMVVLGLGGIGSEIARLGRALGMKVIGVRRSPARPDDPVERIVPPAQLSRVLPEAQWLAIACPLTDGTRRLVDAEALALLPRGARVLNVARGEVIEEAALIDALRKGHLAGAYLDVFETEPLPQESPLWELPNVLLSPHNAGWSSGSGARQVVIFLDNLLRFGRGEPLQNRVEPPGRAG